MECNNSPALAQLVPVNGVFNTVLNGYINGFNNQPDTDYFAIHPPQCGVENINITGVNSNQPILIQVFDSLGILIADYQGQPGDSVVSFSVILSDSLYYIRLTSKQPFWPYNYILVDDPFTVSLSYDVSDACECNNTFATACPIPINTTFDAKLWGVNSIISDGTIHDLDVDQDFFKIRPTQCVIENFRITGVNSNQPILIQLFDSLQSLIEFYQGQPGDSVVLLNAFLADSLYYIRLTSKQPFWPYDYILIDDSFTFNLSATNVNCPVGLKENFSFDHIVISPNPASTLLKVQLLNTALKSSTIQILNLLGEKVIENKKMNDNSTSIDVSTVPSGIYFVKIENEKE